MKTIKYKRGYYYDLAETYVVLTPILGVTATTAFISLEPSGKLTIRAGYSWDGASGPAIDTDTIMRGSMIHDALYELMRYGVLDRRWKPEADALLRSICLEDGMSRARAWWVWKGVDLFGGRATRRGRKIHRAPDARYPRAALRCRPPGGR